jgi:polysaccharide pyruvyl transferase WcaK-like protein
MKQLFEGCRLAGINVIHSFQSGRCFVDRYKREISCCDMVIINGEGTMHHDRPGALALMEAGLFAHQMGIPVALINTVWEDNIRANKLLSCCSLVFVRESISAKEIRRAGFDAEIVPDLVLTSCPDHLFQNSATNHGPVIVMDDVRRDKAVMLAHYAGARGLQFCRMEPRPSLRAVGAMFWWGRLCAAGRFAPHFSVDQVSKITRASLVVTGRFHGVCLAILAQRPFVAISSNTHKIEGLLADAQLGECGVMIKDSELETDPFHKIDEAIHRISSQPPDTKERYRESCQRYSKNALNAAAAMFQKIAALGCGNKHASKN